MQLLTDLQAYIKQHHTTGLVWAKTGSKPSGGPPPPPPCGLPPMDDLVLTPANSDATNRSALFAEINRGGDVTKGKYYYYNLLTINYYLAIIHFVSRLKKGDS